MTFDFQGALARAKKDAENKAIEAIVLGPSGAGKSYRAGTFGVKTLYLYSGGESHGVVAADQEANGMVVPIRYDHGASDPDAALKNLVEILASKGNLQKLGVKAVYVDGASEIEFLIRSSKSWKQACLTNKGDHNTFEEPKATIAAFRPIISAMKDLHSEFGTHIAMSLIVDVKEYGDDGEIIECQPRILGYGVAESLIQQFGDTLVVCKLLNEKTQKRERRFTFMTDVVKASKDKNGVVKKSINFTPRLAGVKELPAFMPADFSEVIKLKAKGKQ